ncbi:MAG: hypothetical protein ACJ8R9_29995 [Steroidobacteraceae bacterium]
MLGHHERRRSDAGTLVAHLTLHTRSFVSEGIMATKAEHRVLTEHDEIRNWAEKRDAQPSCVKGTDGEGDSCLLRLDFPGYSGDGSLEHISWERWFRVFDKRNLALIVEDRTAAGQPSNFNKLANRKTADAT